MSSTTVQNLADPLKRHRPFRALLGAGLVVLVGLVPASASRACQADSVISLFERQVGRHQTIRLKYRKESRSLAFGERKPEEGMLWLGPPHRYRVENPTQVIVRGVDTLWSYSPGTQQVTLRVGNLDSLEFGPAGFFGSLRQDFLAVDCRLDSVGSNPAWRVRLAAKTETAPIQRLTLWVDCRTHWATSADYVDFNEENAHLRFTDYRLDQPGDKDRFVFIYPRGVDRVVLPTTNRSRGDIQDTD